MKFNIGDKVSFLNEKGSGVITNILSNHRALIMNEDGFEFSIAMEELVAITDKSDYKTNSRMNERWLNEKEEQEIKPPSQFPADEIWEIDLHLHEMTDSYQCKSDYEKLNFQLNYFRKCMDAAIAHRIKKIIFIHGVGKGTLKQEIIRALKDYEHIRYFDAPYKKYGFGALTIELDVRC